MHTIYHFKNPCRKLKVIIKLKSNNYVFLNGHHVLIYDNGDHMAQTKTARSTECMNSLWRDFSHLVCVLKCFWCCVGVAVWYSAAGMFP